MNLAHSSESHKSLRPAQGRAELYAALLGILCYVNVLPNDFCDDGKPIVQLNYKVNDPGQWGEIWTTDYWSQTRDEWPNRDLLYRPVALSSYRLVRQLCGTAPWPQHAINLLLHALICAGVVRLCRRLGATGHGPLIAGCLFAVLPIHSEVIANVVGRADMLAVLGIILAALAYRRAQYATSTTSILRWSIATGLISFVAMCAKESGVGVIAVVPLLGLYWRRFSKQKPIDDGWLSLRTVLCLVPMGIATLMYGVLRFHALEGQLFQHPALTKTVNLMVDAPTWQRVLGTIQLWGMYWAKTIWPSVLSVNYSVNKIRLTTSPFDFYVALGLVALVVCGWLSVVFWRRGDRGLAFVIVCMLLTYFPTSNSIVLIQVFFAERNWYLPSVWLLMAVGLASQPLMQYRIARLTVGLLLVGMTARCWIRNFEWHSNGTVYAAVYRDHPESIGGRYLWGQWLTTHGRYEEGAKLLERAIEIDLGYTDAHRALGWAHLNAGRYGPALHHLQIANMHVPDHPPTVKGLTLASKAVSESAAEELDELERAAEADKGNVIVWLALVKKLRELGRTEEAITILGEHDPQFTDSASWQSEYAVALLYLDRRDDAVAKYQAATRLDPQDAQLAVELAMLLLERRMGDDIAQAWQLADRANRLAPNAVFVAVCRAELYALDGNLDKAIELYRRAINAFPADSPDRRRLEARIRTLGD